MISNPSSASQLSGRARPPTVQSSVLPRRMAMTPDERRKHLDRRVIGHWRSPDINPSEISAEDKHQLSVSTSTAAPTARTGHSTVVFYAPPVRPKPVSSFLVRTATGKANPAMRRGSTTAGGVPGPFDDPPRRPRRQAFRGPILSRLSSGSDSTATGPFDMHQPSVSTSTAAPTARTDRSTSASPAPPVRPGPVSAFAIRGLSRIANPDTGAVSKRLTTAGGIPGALDDRYISPLEEWMREATAPRQGGPQTLQTTKQSRELESYIEATAVPGFDHCVIRGVRETRRRAVGRPPLPPHGVSPLPKGDGKTLAAKDKGQEASMMSTSVAAPRQAPANIGTQRTASYATATPSKIPRLDRSRSYVPSDLSEGSLASAPPPSASTIRSTPQHIPFPCVANLDSPIGKQTPLRDAAQMSSAGRQARTRKISTASDIDDKLRQSMMRMPRVSGLSNGDSPLGVQVPDSGRSAANVSGRIVNHSSLATVTRSAQRAEGAALAANRRNIDGNTLLRLAASKPKESKFIVRSPDMYAKLRQVNETLEQENLALAFDLAALENQVARHEVEKQDMSQANVWTGLVAAFQAELSLLKRERAERRREMDKFDKMVTLAKLVV